MRFLKENVETYRDSKKKKREVTLGKSFCREFNLLAIHCLSPVDEEGKSKEKAEVEDTDNKVSGGKKTCPICSEEDGENERVAKACSCQSDSSASSEDSAISPDKVSSTSTSAPSHPQCLRFNLASVCNGAASGCAEGGGGAVGAGAAFPRAAVGQQDLASEGAAGDEEE